MEKHLCHNITSGDQNNYSAPVPIIGLYIAGASLVCLLFMSYDVIHAIRHRKFWLPCKWFSLNSLTLTFLSVAAKLPVDLTTPMPGVWDQLSKLTGTAFICVCMGYFVPSLGANSASENTTNMAALSIFVITVIVNICIQISTGVIFSFVLEHIIIMCFMFAMLNFLWRSTLACNMNKEILFDRKKQVFTEGKGSLTVLQRLKLCYLHGYKYDLQLSRCNGDNTTHVNTVGSLCLVVVIQVLVRIVSGHGLRSCNGTSDYGWSISIIVATQILVILVACLITSFRKFMASTRIIRNIRYTIDKYDYDDDDIEGIHESSPFLNNVDDDNFCYVLLKVALRVGCKISFHVIVKPVLAVYAVFQALESELELESESESESKSKSESEPEPEPEGMGEYKYLRRKNEFTIPNWILIKCMKEIQRCMSKGKAENKSLCHLPQLLSNTPPSSPFLEQLHNRYNFKSGNDVSCLYLVFLARIASVSIPPSLSSHLITPSLNEVFDIIRFVDSKINPPSFSNKKKQYLAKAMWMGKHFRGVALTFEELAESRDSHPAMSSELDCVHFIIAQLEIRLRHLCIWDELKFVVDFIDKQKCTTVQELFTCMEQLFVDMLHIFLIQFPQAVCKEVTECPVEEYTKKVKLMLKFISQVELLEGKVEWSFPDGCGINSLISTPASSTDDHDSARTDSEEWCARTDSEEWCARTDRSYC